MFYHINSLKKGGRFYICWVADSWPERFKKIPEKQINRCHIPNLCNDLLEVIITESWNPNKRFSLRLSSHIMMVGLLYFNERVQAGVENILNPRQKIPRRNRDLAILVHEHEIPLEIPNNVLPNNNLTVNASAITLQEEPLPPTVIANDGFGDELCPVEQLLLQSAQDPLFDKTIAGIQGPEETIAAEIEHPEIPLLEVTETLQVPEPDKNIMIEEPPQPPTTARAEDNNKRRHEEMEEVEELDQNITPRVTKRRKKVFVIQDQETKLTSEYMTKRFADKECLRKLDRGELKNTYKTAVNAARPMLFPASDPMFMSIISKQLLKKFSRNLLVIPRQNFYRSRPEIIEREVLRAAQEPTNQSARNITGVNLMTDQSTDPHTTLSTNFQALPMMPNTSALITSITDRSLLPDLTLLPHQGSHGDLIVPNLSARISPGPELVLPQAEQPQEETTAEDIPVKTMEITRKTSVGSEEPLAENFVESRAETALGSLDRTEVSLGGNETSFASEAKEYLTSEWNKLEILKKVRTIRATGVCPVTLDTVMEYSLEQASPPLLVTTRMIIIRIFTNLLELKKRDVLSVYKKPGTLEIQNILMGSLYICTD